jgi:hypothetical protein
MLQKPPEAKRKPQNPRSSRYRIFIWKSEGLTPLEKWELRAKNWHVNGVFADTGEIIEATTRANAMAIYRWREKLSVYVKITARPVESDAVLRQRLAWAKAAPIKTERVKKLEAEYTARLGDRARPLIMPNASSAAHMRSWRGTPIILGDLAPRVTDGMAHIEGGDRGTHLTACGVTLINVKRSHGKPTCSVCLKALQERASDR